jgi:hypothetical protein
MYFTHQTANLDAHNDDCTCVRHFECHWECQSSTLLDLFKNACANFLKSVWVWNTTYEEIRNT